MKKLVVLGVLLISGLGFSQTYSGSVYIKWNSTNGTTKWVRYSHESCDKKDLIQTGNIYWSPTNAQLSYECSFGNPGRDADWYYLLNIIGAGNDVYQISTDPNNPTLININPNSDLLKTLNLGDFVWHPKSFNEQMEIHFKVNEVNLSNEYFNKSTVTVYPNPTSDYLNFNIDNEVNVKIFDLYGKMVMNQKVTKQVSLSDLNKGLYLVEVSNNDIQYKTKIIKF